MTADRGVVARLQRSGLRGDVNTCARMADPGNVLSALTGRRSTPFGSAAATVQGPTNAGAEPTSDAFGIEPYLAFDAVPEPATLSLLGIGGLLALRRRKA